MPWFVYLVRCSDGSLYCGSTTDVDRRLAEHNDGTGARYTRSRRPVRLAWQQRVLSRGGAQSLEYLIKRMRKRGKEKLINGQATPGIDQR